MYVFFLIFAGTHFSPGCNSFYWPAVERNKLQGSIKDSNLKLLLCLVLLPVLSTLVLVTTNKQSSKIQAESYSLHALETIQCFGWPCVCPVSLLGCSFRGWVLMGGCCRILFARVSLVVFMIGGRGFVRSWVILKPGYGAVETSTQAAALGPCGCGRSYHCRGKYKEADEGKCITSQGWREWWTQW